METVRLPQAIANQIRRHAEESPDEEVCGLIAGDASGAMRCLPVTNVARDKSRFFQMDPREQIDAMRAMRERGEQLIGIYHSHPSGPAEPSRTDIEQQEYAEAFYIIISLKEDSPGLRAFRIRNGKATEVRVEIEPAPAP